MSKKNINLSLMAFANPRVRRALSVVLLLGVLLTIATRWPLKLQGNTQYGEDPATAKDVHGQASTYAKPRKAVVMPKMKKDNVQWALDLAPDWQPYIYTTSTPPEAPYLMIPKVRGRESLVYLTYIIDNYDDLPAYTAFVHGARDQWHNDLLGASTTNILRNLRLDTVDRLGFVNFRCSHEPGCPVGVNPLDPSEADLRENGTRANFPEIYMELFNVPRSKVPLHLGNVCCGQFAVSRKRIRERSKADYERMRRWAMESDITDDFGIGWVFEKVWHVMFGMDAVHCPEFKQCRCDLVGWCGPLPKRFETMVKGAHPWLGSKLGRIWGNDNAAGNWYEAL